MSHIAGLPAVRDGRNAPVTCAACGCRLEASGPAGSETWHHFGPMAGRDARGCRVDCVEQAHDAGGRVMAEAAA